MGRGASWWVCWLWVLVLACGGESDDAADLDAGSGADGGRSDAAMAPDASDVDAAGVDAGSDDAGLDDGGVTPVDASLPDGGADLGAPADAAMDGGAAYWTVHPPVSGVDFRAVHGADATHVWAVGSGGAVVHFDGTGWVTQRTGAETLTAVFAADAMHVYVVGLGGARGCSDDGGVSWSFTTSDGAPDLYTVVARPAHDEVVVSGDGAVVERTDLDCTTWTREEYPATGFEFAMRGAVVAEDNRVFAAGLDGQILTNWSTKSAVGGAFAYPDWYATWSNPVASTFHTTVVVGDGGWGLYTMRDGIGDSWYSIMLHGAPRPSAFHGVWGSDAENIVLVGEGSSIFVRGPQHYFAELPPIAPVSLRGVWGSSANDVWVVGFGGTILHHP